MGSRLEAVGKTHGPDIGFLDQVLGLRAVPGEVDGQVVEGVQVLQGLAAELGVAHSLSSNHRRGRSDTRTSCSSSSAATSSRMVW